MVDNLLSNMDLKNVMSDIEVMVKEKLKNLIIQMSFSPYKYLAYKVVVEDLWDVPVVKIKSIYYWDRPNDIQEGYVLVDITEEIY